MAKLTLKRGRAKPVWHGHPWIFSEAVDGVAGDCQPGDVVEVLDAEGRRVGHGFYNPRSQIRVRMLGRDVAVADTAFVARRLAAALDLRRRLGLPSADTTCYRLVNSEGDGLPGLVVDVYGQALSLQFTALGMKRIEGEVLSALEDLLHPDAIYEASPGAHAELEGFAAGARLLRGSGQPRWPCREHGMKLEVDPLSGQKTGLYLDQRESRRLVERLAGGLTGGARVLDGCCYLGGFSLAALRGGAAQVTAVDVSPRALAQLGRHAAQNDLAAPEAVESDIFRFLETAPARRYDLMVLDPPKFARSRKDLEAALRGYRRLNALALTACAEGALLVTCSCSQIVSPAEFERVLAAAALDARRTLRVLSVSSQGPDHPVLPSFPEGCYLKVVLCRVE